MIFRRRKAKDEPAEEPATTSRRCRAIRARLDELDELERARPNGPWDRSETDRRRGRGLPRPRWADRQGRPGLELRLQVDEAAQTVAAVMLAGPESGLELRAFAAPRWDGIWDEVRKDIAAEAAKRGGTATELDGEFGTELKIVVPVQTPDGRKATQTSRIVGVDGPRWLLRGTFLGKSAQRARPRRRRRAGVPRRHRRPR